MTASQVRPRSSHPRASTTPRALLFAPLPPPVGGIASVTAMLLRAFDGSPEILFVQPVPKTTGWRAALRPLIGIARLARSTARIARDGRVVFFSSSRASFWEKCAWAAFVLLSGRSVAVIMVAGDIPPTFAASAPLAQAAARWLFRRRKFVLAAQSPSWAALYRGLFPGTTVTHVGATVDPEFFEERVRAAEANQPLTLLFVGWIIRDKGILDLLDAVQIAKGALAGRARVRLVGPLFGREAYWQEEIDRRGLHDIVTLAGPVTGRAEMLREYRGADAFVFPSHYEGFPLSLIEAAASGLPCIATDVGGAADILRDGEAGIIVPRQSPPELAAALTAIVTDDTLRARLGADVARHARATFSRDAFVASYARLLGIA